MVNGDGIMLVQKKQMNKGFVLRDERRGKMLCPMWMGRVQGGGMYLK